MKRSMALLGGALLLATPPQAMAQGQQPSRAPAATGDAAPAAPGQVTTNTGGATPGETSPSVRPPLPSAAGQQGVPSPSGTQEPPRGTPGPASDQGQRR